MEMISHCSFKVTALITYLLSDLFLLVALLLQELLELEALQLHLPLSLVLEDALVGLHLVRLVPPFDLLLRLVVDPVLLLPHEREVPLYVTVGARAALGGQTDAVVHLEAEGTTIAG